MSLQDTREIATAKIVMVGGGGGGGGMPENPLATNHGGTGNADGYIRTGAGSGTVGTNATVEGSVNIGSGVNCHVEGSYNQAGSGASNSHVSGYANTSNYANQTVVGVANENKSGTYFEVGNGSRNGQHKNAFEVYSNGNATVQGNLTVGAAITGGTVSDQNGRLNAVVANPSDAASLNLSKIKIGGTAYNISGGGGGGSYTLGIGECVDVTSHVIDTNVCIGKVPENGDKFIVIFDEPVVNPASIKIYSDTALQTAYTIPFASVPSGFTVYGTCAFSIMDMGGSLALNVLTNETPYTAGDSISIQNKVISNTAPHVGVNIGSYSVTSAVTDGNIGTLPYEDDFYIITFGDNAQPNSETNQYTALLRTSSSPVVMYQAMFTWPYGYYFRNKLFMGMSLLCRHGSGSGTSADPIRLDVLNVNRGYIDFGRRGGTAIGERSTAEGRDNAASGDYSHAEGMDTTASGFAAHAEGDGTMALADYTHTEGYMTSASSYYAHAEGHSANATGQASHAEGRSGLASASYAHAEGYACTAGGEAAHAEGSGTSAAGAAAHASGDHTRAAYAAQTSVGKYNDNKSTTLFEVGYGTDNNSRSNVFEVYNDGKISCDNGNSKFKFTQSSGVDGYVDSNGTFHPFGGGSGFELSKKRYTITASSWSNNTDADGYYTYNVTLSNPTLDTSYPPNVYLAGATDSTFYTDTEKTQYGYVEQCNLTTSSNLTLYAKTKPDTTFYVFIEGQVAS